MTASVQLLEYGIYDFDEKKSEKIGSETSPTGYYIEANNLTLKKTTDKIPIIRNTTFGIKYKLLTSSIPVKVILYHPEIENPDTLYTFSKIETSKVIENGKTYYDFYTLEYNYEFIPGFWSFQIVYENNLLLEKEFELYIEQIEQDDAEEENFFYDM